MHVYNANIQQHAIVITLPEKVHKIFQQHTIVITGLAFYIFMTLWWAGTLALLIVPTSEFLQRAQPDARDLLPFILTPGVLIEAES